LDHFPNFGGENKKYLKPPHSDPRKITMGEAKFGSDDKEKQQLFLD